MKVLIFYASYGGGHYSTAKSMKEIIEKLHPEYEAEMIDCMEYLSKTVNYVTVKGYERMTKKPPKLWGIAYGAARKGPISHMVNSTNKLFSNKLCRLIKEKNPDYIISSHPFSSAICGNLKKKGKITIPVATIMTDFKYHEQWLVNHKYLEKFFVSNENMKQELIKYGVDSDKIYVTGMPISPRFSEKYDRNLVLNEFNLKDNLKTIIFFAGGKMGLARKNIFDYIENLIKSLRDDTQLVAISGKNEKVYEKFREISEDLKNENVKIIEFTEKVPELMSIADLVITKPRRNNSIRMFSIECTYATY